MLVNCREALVAELQQLKTFFNSLTLRLYKNDKVPLDTDDAGDYTEADFTGYDPIPLDSWGNAYLNAGNIAEINEIVRTFEQTGTAVTCLVYGYYVTDVDGDLVWAERNPAGSVNMNATGLTYSVLPRQTLKNQT